MKRNSSQFKIFFLAILFSSFLSVAQVSKAAVIFEDNFDDHSDWSPDQPIYPNTTANTSSNGAADGTTACTGCPDGQAKYGAYYIASSAWDGYKGNNTLNISSDNARNGAGKSLTVWHEPIDSALCDGATKWCSDGDLLVRLPSDQPEIFLRFYIKFDSNWVWDYINGNSSMKIVHMSHYDPNYNGNIWDWFGPATGNRPFNVLNFGYPRNGGGGDAMILRWMPRYQSTWLPSYAAPPLSLINRSAGDIQDFYFPGGTGYGGNKKWNEFLGDGNWHHIEFHFKFNTSGGYYSENANGVFEMYLDNTLVIQRSDVAWADGVDADNNYSPQPALGWNLVAVGGNMYNRYYADTIRNEQWYAVDDVVISTSYVGPDYIIGADTTPPSAPSGLSVN